MNIGLIHTAVRYLRYITAPDNVGTVGQAEQHIKLDIKVMTPSIRMGSIVITNKAEA